MKKLYSHSRISTYKMCPKQFEYKYINKLVPLESNNNNLFLGSLVHKGIELKSEQDLLNHIEELKYTVTEGNGTLITLALAMVEAYFKKFGYNEIVRNELHFNIPLDNITTTKTTDLQFHGYIDGIIEEEDGYWLLEIKTASIIDKTYIDKLIFNDQIERYLYATANGYLENFTLDKPLLGIKYRIIKKPLIRQKQKESIMEFRQRLIEKLQEEDNIIEVILNRTDEELEDSIKDTLHDILTIETTTRFTKTLSACSTYGRCPYMELCSKEEQGELLYIVKEEERRNEDVTRK